MGDSTNDSAYLECEQQSLDNRWSLDRINACHIRVLNDETGKVWKAMDAISTNNASEHATMRMDINALKHSADIVAFIGTAILVTVMGILLNAIWEKIIKGKK